MKKLALLVTLMGASMQAATNMVQTPSGLRYQIIKEGKGPKVATKGTIVTVHYTGWLNDGKDGHTDKPFDSSVKRAQPFQFNLGAAMVIAGWDEGVAGMKQGEKRILYIPSKLGYGARGAPGVIPPNADLIFEVEYLG